MDVKMIDVSELAYQRFVLKQFHDAQAVMRAWSQHLAAKYQLGPKDTVTEQGEIIRAEPTPLREVRPIGTADA